MRTSISSVTGSYTVKLETAIVCPEQADFNGSCYLEPKLLQTLLSEKNLMIRPISSSQWLSISNEAGSSDSTLRIWDRAELCGSVRLAGQLESIDNVSSGAGVIVLEGRARLIQ